MSVNSDTSNKIVVPVTASQPTQTVAPVAVATTPVPSAQPEPLVNSSALRRPPSAPIVPVERVRPAVAGGALVQPKGRGRPKKVLAPLSGLNTQTEQKGASLTSKLDGSAALASTVGSAQKAEPTIMRASAAKQKAAQPKAKVVAPAKATEKVRSFTRQPVSADAGHAFKMTADLAVTQARDLFEVVKSTTDHLSSGFEKSTRAAQEGAVGAQTRLATLMQSQVDAAFGYLRDLAQVRSVSDMIELNSTVLRRQFDENAKQVHEINAFAGRTAALVVQPVRDAVTGLTSGR